MINTIKKYLAPELPSAMLEAERELRDAEREFLEVMTKLDYYTSMAECHTMRILRLREVIRLKDVLAMPSDENEISYAVKH